MTGVYLIRNAPAAGPPTVSNGQRLSISGTGFGTKSAQLAPIVFDNQQDVTPGAGLISPQWTANQTAPVGGTGANAIYNTQNQPVGYSPSTFDVGQPHPFVGGVVTGAHLNLTNQYNDVVVAKAIAGTPTSTFCLRQSFYWRCDNNWVENAQSDNNFKDLNYNEGLVTYPSAPLDRFFYTAADTQTSASINNIRAITNTNPLTFNLAVPTATNPLSIGQKVSFFGVPGMTELNGLGGLITGVSGGNNNWQGTVASIDATGFGTYPGALTVTAIDKTNNIITFNSSALTNPVAIGDTVGFSGLGGMTQLNNVNLAKRINVVGIGGMQGAWTMTIDQSLSSFSAYTSGGIACMGTAGTPQSALGTSTVGYNTDGNGQPVAGPPFMMQNPDKNGHNNFWGSMFYPMNSQWGWIKRTFEMCVDPTVNGVGYVRVTDTSLAKGIRNVIMNYKGNTTTALTGNICLAMGNYSRDRSPNNRRFYCDGYIDITAGGVSGQCAAVFVGDNPSFANCVVLEEQPNITSWSDTDIEISSLRQGALQPGTIGYIFVATESGAAGTAIASGSITIGNTSVPTIQQSSLPGATHGVAYSTTITAANGTAPYKFYLPTTTSGILAINQSTGVLSGTLTSAGTERVVVSVQDANGVTSYKIFSLTVS